MADDSSSDDAPKVPFTLALIAGGCAGTAVDVALYPLDTLRTRMQVLSHLHTPGPSSHASHALALTLQAPEGFMKAGGFSGVYNGVMATALGAAPGAALFFSAYEGMKPKLQALNGGKEHPLQHSFAASCGEVAACLVRVPTAVVTQRMQVGQYQNYPQAMKARRLCRRAARRVATAAGAPQALGRSSSAQATAWVWRRARQRRARGGLRALWGGALWGGGAAGGRARQLSSPSRSRTPRRSTPRRD